MINLAYGTSLAPDDLAGWAESDIAEAVELAKRLSTGNDE
jgi:hypothetical protein